MSEARTGPPPQERFAALARPYFRNADGVMIAYDVGRRSTFERATTYWMQVAQKI